MGVKQCPGVYTLFNRLYIILCVYFLFLMWERLCIGNLGLIGASYSRS